MQAHAKERLEWEAFASERKVWRDKVESLEEALKHLQAEVVIVNDLRIKRM